MLWIWRFLIGYLTIRIDRENGEKILNCAATAGINIWNLHYKNGNIYGNISTRNFLKLYNVRKGTKCRIKIIKKHGLIFYTKKYKNRIGFLTGIIVFFSTLIYLANFIWIIDTTGNKNITRSQIIASCKKIGIYEGISKSKINHKYSAQRLQLEQEGIAWCAFNTEGSVLTVNLSETEVSDGNERQTPSNLKSVIEGKIKKINVATGDVLVKVGDTVSKGELLVSGVIHNMSSTLFVHSSGKIIAETKRVFSAQGDFLQSKNKETGEIIKRYTLEVFGKKIPLYLGKIKKPHNYKCVTKNLKLFSKRIPIKIACEQYKLTKKEKITYDIDDLEKILYKDIEKQVKNFEFLSFVESGRESIITDNGVLLNITYSCEENIAIQDGILLSKAN